MRVLAIGDIHTKKWIIDKVEALVDKYDAIVFCGDYADDWGASGLDSISTWRKLYYLQEAYPEKVRLVRGNHDYVYLEDVPSLQSGYNQMTQFLIDSDENKYLKGWLKSLPLVLELDGVTYAHGGIDERWSGETDVDTMWSQISPIWVRPDWARYKNIPQVVGHTPQRTCTEIIPNVWLIDTFSTMPDGSPIGDGTVLEVIDGKTFNKIPL